MTRMRRLAPQRTMTQHHPISMRSHRPTQGDDQRQGRRLSIATVAVILTLSLAFIAWQLWVVDSLRDRLAAMPVVVDAVAPLEASVVGLRVQAHQGPGQSAYFDLIVGLRMRRGPGAKPALVRVDATLEDHEGKPLYDLEPKTLPGLRSGEERNTELVWSPVPKPIAERAGRMTIRAR